MEITKPVITREFDLIETVLYGEARIVRRSSLWTMVDKLLLGSHGKAEARRLRVALHFKRCPLCEALNMVESPECGTCGWFGTFDNDPTAVEARFVQLIEGCPSLKESMPSQPTRGMSLRVRLRRFWRSMNRRRIDLQV